MDEIIDKIVDAVKDDSTVQLAHRIYILGFLSERMLFAVLESRLFLVVAAAQAKHYIEHPGKPFVWHVDLQGLLGKLKHAVKNPVAAPKPK